MHANFPVRHHNCYKCSHSVPFAVIPPTLWTCVCILHTCRVSAKLNGHILNVCTIPELAFASIGAAVGAAVAEHLKPMFIDVHLSCNG